MTAASTNRTIERRMLFIRLSPCEPARLAAAETLPASYAPAEGARRSPRRGTAPESLDRRIGRVRSPGGAFLARADRPAPPGLARNVGCYVVETDDGLALYDCGPTPCIPALKAGLADAGPRARRHPPSAPLPHPLRPRRRRRRPGARAPVAAGARLGDRRAAPRRPLAARGERAPALRRQLRPPLGRARPGPGGEHRRRRRRRPRARMLPEHRPRESPRLDAARGRHAATPATRAASASHRDASCSRRRRRPTSTSRRGSGRSRRPSCGRPHGSR